jgi:maltose alpha-D-glucosyltransferase/alpha-amylase
LITLRKQHAALHNSSKIEFVFAQKNEYPLAYVRSNADEKILVVINPSDRTKSFSCNYKPRRKCYHINGDITVENGVITVPGNTAVFYQI